MSIKAVIQDLYKDLPPFAREPLLKLFREDEDKFLPMDELLCNLGFSHMDTVVLRRQNRYQFSLVGQTVTENLLEPNALNIERRSSSSLQKPLGVSNDDSIRPESEKKDSKNRLSMPVQGVSSSPEKMAASWKVAAKTSPIRKEHSFVLGKERLPPNENEIFQILTESEYAKLSLFLDYDISTAEAITELAKWSMVYTGSRNCTLSKTVKQNGKVIYKQELGELKHLKQYRLKKGDTFELRAEPENNNKKDNNNTNNKNNNNNNNNNNTHPIEVVIEYSPIVVDEMNWKEEPVPNQTPDFLPVAKKSNIIQSIFSRDKTAVGVSNPYNVQKKAHVNFDFKWTGQKPEQIFEIKEELGKGAFGAVVLGTHKETKFNVAIKRIPVTKVGRKVLEKEIDVLKSCKSPDILSYYGTVSSETEVWILMDYCAVGSIKDLMVKMLEPLEEDQIAPVAQQTLKGLAYLHGHKILHLDIKAGNLMLTEEGKVKLGDFGVSQAMNNSTVVLDKEGKQDLVGSPLYMAPEIIKKEPYDEHADIWSFGITMIELAEGRPPNTDIKNIQSLHKIVEREPPTLKNPKAFSKSLSDFISKCLVKDPLERPDAIELLTHPFTRTGSAESLKPTIRNYLKKVRPSALQNENI